MRQELNIKIDESYHDALIVFLYLVLLCILGGDVMFSHGHFTLRISIRIYNKSVELMNICHGSRIYVIHNIVYVALGL